MSIEYGLFNDESANYTADESVEAGFYSVAEAQNAIDTRYSAEDELTIRAVEEPEDDEDESDDGDGERDQFMHDGEADGDALRSAGWGTDEDYGGIGGEDW